MVKTKFVRTLVCGALIVAVLIGSTACGAIFGPEETPAPTATPTIALMPTFTPTPITEPPPETLTAQPTQTEVAQAEAVQPEPVETEYVETEAAVDSTSAQAQAVSLTTAVTATVDVAVDAVASATLSSTVSSTVTSESDAAPQEALSSPAGPVAIVAAEIVNVRRGPATTYEIVGSANLAQQLPITGRNAQGDWWQVCCFEGEQPGWVYGPLVEAQNSESVALAVDIPPAPTPLAEPAPLPESTPLPEPAVAEVVEAPAAPPVEEAPPAAAPAPAAAPVDQGGTAGNFDPNAQFHIVDYKVYGFDENNGGIFNNGGQHIIFINVLDENGQGIDGAVVKDALADNFSIVTGSKGPGRAEFEMFWEPYKLYVASIPGGPVTSQISNQMNTAKPHIPDIIGKMGPADNEYAICPTPDDRCEPPFYHAHWSYEVTFQKVK